MKTSTAAAGSSLFFALAPGVVAGVVPWWLTGWEVEPDRLCWGVMDALQAGFPAVQVVERHRLRVDAWWPLWLTPIGLLWETWRGMGWEMTVAWLAWIWSLWVVARTRALPSP